MALTRMFFFAHSMASTLVSMLQAALLAQYAALAGAATMP